jgi:threonyl-tRNA synthetase
MTLPEKFELEYMDNDGQLKRPVMIHRVLFGSIERFMGILIEHFAGKFPLWLSPRQVCIITVADRHNTYAHQLAAEIKKAHFLCDVDDTGESVNKKIRNAQLMQYNYMLTIGDKEFESRTINLRTRDNHVHGEMQLKDFITAIEKESATKSLKSSFTKEEAHA